MSGLQNIKTDYIEVLKHDFECGNSRREYETVQ